MKTLPSLGVEVQLPLVLEVVEQQALGHPRPLGDGVGGGLAEEIDRLFLEYKRNADMLRRFLYKEEYL